MQPLTNLKHIDLWGSYKLKEIPNLSKAINLERLTISNCESLVEIPSSISNLHKLKELDAERCIKLQVVPNNINLTSLEYVNMNGCSQLTSLPDFSRNIKKLGVNDSKIKEYPASILRHLDRLEMLMIGSRSLKRLIHVPLSVTLLNLRSSDIKKIPDCVIGLPHLQRLFVVHCTKLVLIQGLPPSLEILNANDCVSLKKICFSFHNPMKELKFYNCLNLDEESRRRIIQQSYTKHVYLPGKEIPEEFTHKATGNSITIPLAPCCEVAFSMSLRFKACILLSPIKGYKYIKITCHLRSKGGFEFNTIHRLSDRSSVSLSKHLCIICDDLFDKQNRCLEMDVTTNEILFEFSCEESEYMIIECGVQILRKELGSISSSEVEYEAEAYKVSKDKKNQKQ